MVVQELIEMLEDLPGGLEVKIAYQPSYPLEADADGPVEVMTSQGDGCVYIPVKEGVGNDYLNREAKCDLGW